MLSNRLFEMEVNGKTRKGWYWPNEMELFEENLKSRKV